MKYSTVIGIALIVLAVLQVCVVGPLLLVLTEHTISLERRTAILCPNGLPTPETIIRPRPDGCLP